MSCLFWRGLAAEKTDTQWEERERESDMFRRRLFSLFLFLFLSLIREETTAKLALFVGSTQHHRNIIERERARDREEERDVLSVDLSNMLVFLIIDLSRHVVEH